jgi:hypothetical protein
MGHYPDEETFVTQPGMSSGPPAAPPAGPINLGFVTVLNEANGYVGGYLVTNTWGRPLEFRLSSAVVPNRVQQILYADTLEPYVCADLIAKTLIDKAGLVIHLLVTDRPAVLEVRHKLEVPVVWVAPPEDAQARRWADQGWQVQAASAARGPVVCHPRYGDDVARARAVLGRIDSALDLGEPFGRVRDAIGEARKLGVTAARAA